MWCLKEEALRMKRIQVGFVLGNFGCDHLRPADLGDQLEHRDLRCIIGVWHKSVGKFAPLLELLQSEPHTGHSGQIFRHH